MKILLTLFFALLFTVSNAQTVLSIEAFEKDRFDKSAGKFPEYGPTTETYGAIKMNGNIIEVKSPVWTERYAIINAEEDVSDNGDDVIFMETIDSEGYNCVVIAVYGKVVFIYEDDLRVLFEVKRL